MLIYGFFGWIHIPAALTHNLPTRNIIYKINYVQNISMTKEMFFTNYYHQFMYFIKSYFTFKAYYNVLAHTYEDIYYIICIE